MGLSYGLNNILMKKIDVGEVAASIYEHSKGELSSSSKLHVRTGTVCSAARKQLMIDYYLESDKYP